MPTGAILGAVGAVSSIGGSLIQSNAASQASQEQYQSTQNALSLQKQMFGTAQNALKPYYQAGAAGIPQLQTALGTLQSLTSPGTASSTLQSLPGFQFQSQWGNLSTTNQLAAEGLGGSAGPLGKALSDYNNGLAGTYFQNYYGDALNTVGALQNFTNTGANAAGALAGDAINSGNAMASTTQAGGNALASGTLGSANALAGGLGGASNAYLLNALMGNKAGGIYGGFNYGNADTASAAQAGVQSGLQFNPQTGEVW